MAARTKSCSSDRSYYCRLLADDDVHAKGLYLQGMIFVHTSAASPGDSEGWIQEAFQRAFLAAQDKHRELVDLELEVTMPHMRFLHYADVGGGLPPHLDLVRTDEKGRRSTHTFILYLSDCSGGGGETVLLHRMEDEHGDLTHQACPSKKRSRESCQDNAEAVLAAVEPRRGRLLLFPHLCPHLARPTVVVPKLLLRGVPGIGTKPCRLRFS